MLNQFVVGQQNNASGSAPITARGGRQGDQIVSELHGRYYEQSVNRNMFSAVTLARATSLAATAQVGFILFNPPGSGVDLVLNKYAIAVVATSAACTGFTLAGGAQDITPTGLTAADFSGCTVIDKNTQTLGKGRAYALATLVTAPVNQLLLGHNTAAINTVGANDQISGDFEGSVVVKPGGLIAICATGAAAAASAVNTSVMWEEVPTV